MNAIYEAAKRNYSGLPLIDIIMARESIAIKQDEIYVLGMNPTRENTLKALTDLMEEKLKSTMVGEKQ